MSKANVFEVVRLDAPMPWTVRHVPSGLYAGSFHYRAHALAAAAALELVVADWPELAETRNQYRNVVLSTLMEARKPHTAADLTQAKAAEAQRKKAQRKKAQP